MNLMKQKKKILIIEADYGGGHKSITTAVMECVGKLSSLPFKIKIFNFAHPMATKGYQVTETSNDLIYKFAFLFTDRYFLNRYEISSMVNFYLKRQKLTEVLISFKPDVVFINNQFAIQRVPELIKKICPKSKSIVFVPDPFTPHSMVYNPNADLTLVATNETFEKALAFKIPRNKLVLTGHPVREAFYNLSKSKSKLRKKLGLSPDLFTILLGGSGDGADKILPIVKGLIDLHESLPKFQMIAVTGGNQVVEKNLKRLKVPDDIGLHVRGYEKNMPAVMHTADITVGKAGPNLILETIASKIPFVATFYLNQEKGNIDYVKNHNLGYVATETETAVKLLASLIRNPKKIDRLKNHILKEREIHRYAAKNISKQILRLMD